MTTPLSIERNYKEKYEYTNVININFFMIFVVFYGHFIVGKFQFIQLCLVEMINTFFFVLLN